MSSTSSGKDRGKGRASVVRVAVHATPTAPGSDLQNLMNSAIAATSSTRRQFVTPESILLQLVLDPEVMAHLSKHGVDMGHLTASLKAFVQNVPSPPEPL